MTGDTVTMAGSVPVEIHDGIDARRHVAEATWGPEGLSLTGEGLAECLAWSRLTWIDTLPEAILLGRTDRPDWRLRLALGAPADLLALLPQRPRFGRWIDRFGFGPSLACCAAISTLVAYVAINTPSWLGRRLPIAWETGLSDDRVEDLAANTCHTPASDAALAQLVARLDQNNGAGELPPIRIELIKLDVVNAVALPGGRVLVFDGLARRLRSPDTLAGVIGHEIGHVRQRHVMQAMLREFGISMVLSGFKTGVTNTLGRMTALRYSREAEAEADDFARARLARAGISPLPTAGFFTEIAEQSDSPQMGMAAYLNSHPDPVSRATAFGAAYRSNRRYRAALSEAQFEAIRTACAEDRRAQTWTPDET